jgi:hypothetical protein
MAIGPSSRLRRAGAAALVCGGMLLLSHPGFTAPVRRSRRAPRLTREADSRVRNLLPGNPRPARPGLPQPGDRTRPALPVPDPSLPAVPPPGNELMPVSEIKPGMKGYGLTVFRGTKIERFDVEVVGVMPKSNFGEPLILVRLTGGPISSRGAYLIQGMSGSPIYVNGKLLGAFSQGEGWPKEPLGMVTPIENMLEALDPKLSQNPGGEVATGELNGGGFDVASVNNLFSNNTPDLSVLQALQNPRPLALPISVSGLSRRNLDRLARVFAPYNMTVMQGSGAAAEPFKAELVPGAAVGIAFSTGDVQLGGMGTVTWRKGDELVAFGHPMMQLGATQFPMTTAWVHDVFPGFQVSHKIWSFGDPVGTLIQDRPFSVAGRVGPLPAMIPVHYTVKDMGNGRSRTYDVQCANHPRLVGQLLPIVVNEGLFNTRPVPGDTVARVKMTVETDGAGTLTRENVFYDAAQIDVVAIRELMELMGLLSNNSFRRVPVKKLDVAVTFEDKRPTATLERAFISQETFKPGDEVEVGAVLRPYRKDPVVVKTKIRIPENAADGRAVLMVQGGGTRVDLGALMTGSTGQPGGGSAPPPDASLKQVLKRWQQREHNDQLVVRVLFPTSAVNVNGERLSKLPSTIVDVMRSAKSTGFRIERDEAKALHATGFIVQGLQALPITVQKEDRSEQTGTAGRPAGGAPGAGFTPGAGSRPVNLSASTDDDDLVAPQPGVETFRLSVDGKPFTLRLATPELEERDAKAEKAKKDEPKKEERAAKGSDKKDAAKPAAAPEKPADPAVTASSTDNKLLGRPATVWTQSAQADFERGTFTNAAVGTEGSVELAPALELAHESSEQYVWSVASIKGIVYAGTGNGGLVVKVDPKNQASVFFRTGELEVHALAKDKAGNLYAGTSPNGKLFKIAPDGTGTEFYSLNGSEAAADAGGKFILCLAAGPDGTLYAGAGPNGKVLKIRTDGPKPEVTELCTLPDASVMSLLAAADGTLYAGTAEDGTVFRIKPDGTYSIAYDTDQAAVTGLALDSAGNLYAACAPSGVIYKIEKDGAARVHFNKSKGALYALEADRSGTLFTCTANTIMRIDRDGSAALLTDKKKAQFMALAWDDSGTLVAGSANVGSVYRVVPATTGIFESTVHDAKLPAKWGRVRFTGALPPDGKVTVQTRSGNTPDPDKTWSDWAEPAAGEGGTFVASPAARFLQYRVLFAAPAGAPALREISVSYLPRNQVPTLTLAVPAGSEVWSGKQSLKWAATDPDKDTLTYEVSYSADGGRTWKAITGSAAPAAGTPAPAPGSTPPAPPPGGPTRASADEALKQFRAELDKDLSLTPAQRDERFTRAKGMIERYFQEHPEGPPMRPAPGAAAAPSAGSGSTRETSLNWDTKAVEDGVYLVRVVATDKASNPSDAQSVTKVSEPFIISNTPPQLFVFAKGITINPDKTATVVGMIAGRVAVKGAQYRLGTGEWTAIDSEDGIWDSAVEHLRFQVTPQGTGLQNLEVKTVDAAGNVQLDRVKFNGDGSPVPAPAPAPASAPPAGTEKSSKPESKPKKSDKKDAEKKDEGEKKEPEKKDGE